MRRCARKPASRWKFSANHRGEGFEEYIDWRTKHPSDDLMTELLQVEFQDETGTKRKLTREEILIFVSLLRVPAMKPPRV